MLDSYRLGFTPNPDVSCNRHIKFGALLTHLSALASSKNWWLATGHYARVTALGQLLRSADKIKDQTYFLSTISPEALKRCLFPLGTAGLQKSQVKTRAQELRLPGWREGEHTDESFGLCFVEPAGGRNSGFRRFLGEYLPPEPGDVVVGPWRGLYPSGLEEKYIRYPREGAVVGRHEGLWHATVGEKAHLQLPQGTPEFQGRWYVSRKDRKRNVIEVVKEPNNRSLFSQAMTLREWRWLGDDCERLALGGGSDDSGHDIWEGGLVTQFRHGQTPIWVRKMTVLENGEGQGVRKVRIGFGSAQKAVTPGQIAALWDGVRCLGGGVIEDIEGV